MSQPERSVEELLQEAREGLSSVTVQLEEVVVGLDSLGEKLRRHQSELSEIGRQALLHTERERSKLPLQGTVEFLSRGRLTIGKVY